MEKTSLAQSLHLDERRTSASGTPSAATAWRAADKLGDSQFQTYLQQHGLSVGNLSALLSGAAWAPRTDVSWSEWAESLLLHDSGKTYRPMRPLIVESTRLDRLPFDGALESVIASQRKYFDPWRDKLDMSLFQSLLDSLAESIANLSIRCFVNEFSATRPSSQAEHDGPGHSGYDRFNGDLRSPHTRAVFYGKYPMLARLMIHQIGQWRRNTAEFLDRLLADQRRLISQGLVSVNASQAMAVDSTGGDAHNGGACVMTVSYRNGDKVMYKPRDCGSYDFYRGFVGILNESDRQTLPLLAPRSILGLDYGWVEFMSSGGESTDYSSYEFQLGSLLAVCHALGASDMHMDNIVASEQGPVPVDLETIVQNRSLQHEKAEEKATDQLNSTVLGTGILPTIMKTGEDTDIDVSAFSGSLESKAATLTCIAHPFTDEMSIVRTSTVTRRSNNQPRNLTLARLAQYGDAFVSGFLATQQAANDRLGELVKYVKDVTDFRIRCVMRPTRAYSMLLSEMRQPSRMHSGIQMDDLLRKVWVFSPFSYARSGMCWDEERQLRQCDVPLFQTDFDGTSLFSYIGEGAADYYPESTRSYLIRRLLAFSEESPKKSLDFIHQAFLTIPNFRTSQHWRRRTGYSIHLHSDDNPNQTLRCMAAFLQRDLTDKAILGKDDVTWNTVCNDEEKGKYEIKPIGYSLYDGAAGICITLTHASVTFPDSDSKPSELASRIATSLCDIINDWVNHRADIPLGAFSGMSGLIYACTCYTRETGNKLELPSVDATLDRIEEESGKDTLLDVMSGSAGAIAVLSSGAMGRDTHAIRTVEKLARRIIRHATRSDDGALAWKRQDSDILLGGFAHGSTGIGWALSKAADFTKSEDIRDYATQALAFDNHLLDEKRGLWRDARSTDSNPSYPIRWCHGAAGIIMAEYDASAFVPIGKPLPRLARQLITGPLSASDCLCHGTLGNWLALKDVSSSRPENKTAVDHYLQRVVSRILSQGARSGILSGQLDSMGLMLGEAGWLTALLIKINPAIPNPLLLEIPSKESPASHN